MGEKSITYVVSYGPISKSISRNINVKVVRDDGEAKRLARGVGIVPTPGTWRRLKSAKFIHMKFSNVPA